MNLSREWLNEFVEVSASDKDFAEAMTLSGSKVEVTEIEGEEIKNVVVGKVLSLVRHPDSDHMWICQMDVGSGAPVQIVTGADNVFFCTNIKLANLQMVRIRMLFNFKNFCNNNVCHNAVLFHTLNFKALGGHFIT